MKLQNYLLKFTTIINIIIVVYTTLIKTVNSTSSTLLAILSRLAAQFEKS